MWVMLGSATFAILIGNPLLEKMYVYQCHREKIAFVKGEDGYPKVIPQTLAARKLVLITKPSNFEELMDDEGDSIADSDDEANDRVNDLVSNSYKPEGDLENEDLS